MPFTHLSESVVDDRVHVDSPVGSAPAGTSLFERCTWPSLACCLCLILARSWTKMGILEFLELSSTALSSGVPSCSYRSTSQQILTVL